MSKTQKKSRSAGPNGFDMDPERARRAGRKSSNRVPEDLREARKRNATEIEAVIYKYSNMGLVGLKNAFGDPKTPAKDLVVIKILIKAIEQGDPARLEFLLNRTIGKVADKIDHTVQQRPSILIRRDGTEVVFKTEELE